MKKFTVKDFIGYNNPCISCGEKINFRFISHEIDIDVVGQDTLRPTFYSDHLSIDLDIKYNRKLQLLIYPKTNKIVYSDKVELANYLDNNKLTMKSYCNKCYTTIQSMYLEWDLDRCFIKAAEINTERIIVSDDKNMYHIDSFHQPAPLKPLTNVMITRLDRTTPIAMQQFKLPLIPLYRFKTRERFLNKMKTYLIFS